MIDGYIYGNKKKNNNPKNSQPGFSRDRGERSRNKTLCKEKVEQEWWPGSAYGTHIYAPHTHRHTFTYTDSRSLTFGSFGGIWTRHKETRGRNDGHWTLRRKTNRDKDMCFYATGRRGKKTGGVLFRAREKQRSENVRYKDNYFYSYQSSQSLVAKVVSIDVL